MIRVVFVIAALFFPETFVKPQSSQPQDLAQESAQKPATQKPPKPTSESKPPDKEKPAPKPKSAEELAAEKAAAANLELQRVVDEAGGDSAAFVRNLEGYLKKYPGTPRKGDIYRAMVQGALQLRDFPKALDYTERLIAISPADSSMMLLAVELLERTGDERSLTKAVGYATRVLDQIEKTPRGQKSPKVSQAEWELEQNKLRMSVYLTRGRLELARRSYEQAAADLRTSYSILPSTPAALRLAEVFELRKEYEKAIEQYLIAFTLPENYGVEVDNADVRRKLGNVWRMLHGSEAGLGERMLATYDRLAAEAVKNKSKVRNAGLSDPYAFVLRRVDGSELKLAEMRGKTLVLNFWATWCLPCREMEPLFEHVMEKYSERADVAFLAVSDDEDEALVKPYLEREKVRIPVAFSDGLSTLMEIRSIPTVIVLDRNGRIAYRADGLGERFEEELTAAIERALKEATPRAP